LAAADYRASLARRPDSAVTANELAWCLVSKPGRGDADEAVRWARQAVACAPKDANIRNTLEVALYRAGLFREAAQELEPNSMRHAPWEGFDLVFLAMCEQRLGQTESARTVLAQAKRWRGQATWVNSPESAEFRAFLLEAEAVIHGPLPDFPANESDR
jgi:tetratricopeptide (TPR) repeat protein